MKKLWFLTIILVAVLAFAACGDKTDDTPDPTTPVAETTPTPTPEGTTESTPTPTATATPATTAPDNNTDADTDTDTDTDADTDTDTDADTDTDTVEATPEPTPEVVLPSFNRTITLGEFQITNSRNRQKGWVSDGVDNVESPFSATDLTSSRYLVIEFTGELNADFQFIWLGENNGWTWTQSEGYEGQNGILVIDLTTIVDYNQFTQETTNVKFLVGYFGDSWEDLTVTDAYLAN